MSASDDFCGCGEYTCGQCFGLDIEGNAWIDAELGLQICPQCMGGCFEERLGSNMGETEVECRNCGGTGRVLLEIDRDTSPAGRRGDHV